MTLPFRQQHWLRRARRTLVISEPQLASALVMFARLYAGERMPAWEQVQRRPPRPVRVLAHAGWAVICLCGRSLAACGRLLRWCRWLLRRCGRPFRPCGRPWHPCGRAFCLSSWCLRRAAVRCLAAWSFLPAGFRLVVGAWLVAHHAPASVPPAPHEGMR